MNNDIFATERGVRLAKIAAALSQNSCDAILICDNANLYYAYGQVFNGYAYITAGGQEYFFVRRPVGLEGENIIYIRKPENIPDELARLGMDMPKSIALEFDTTSFSDVMRLSKVFPESRSMNGSAIMRAVRSVKTAYEIEKLKESGVRHERVYSLVPSLFESGMTDFELQVEIERKLRLEGCLGQFRVSGQSMEIFMGNLICGDNADNPTPYDFAMGGAGMDPSLPVGCNGTPIRPGMTVMVDMGGNFTGYMTDMTRTFTYGDIPEEALRAHNLSIEICAAIAKAAVPGTPASLLYNMAIDMVKAAGLEHYFMGHNQKAGFIGHGVGIEVNELPVIAPKSKDVITVGNAIALEPKFVIPHVGAVGVENTYIATEQGLECITNAPQQLIALG